MSEEQNKEADEMLDEYDFSQGVVGKYAKQYAEGTNVVLLDPDVAKVFPDSEAVNQALTNLDSVAAPAGEMTVLLGPGWPGVLLHEAIGHGLESDFNRKKTSAFSGRIGQRVASELCTVIDDGTIPSRRGSINGASLPCSRLPGESGRRHRPTP